MQTARGVVGRRWKLVRFLDGPRVQREMYDLASDPHELHSVARDPAYNEVQQRLERRLQELKARRGTDCRS